VEQKHPPAKQMHSPHVLNLLPENFAKSWEYYFQIFFSRDGIQFADKQHVVFRFNVGVRQVTNLRSVQSVANVSSRLTNPTYDQCSDGQC